MKPIRLFNIYGERFGTGYAGNVWDTEGISPAIMTMQGGGREPMILIEIYGAEDDMSQLLCRTDHQAEP